MVTPIHINLFDFTLPKELIAQQPLVDKETAKLLLVQSERLTTYQVKDLINLINTNDLLIFNNTKVIPVRLIGKKGSTSISITLNTKLDNKTWLAFIKNSKRLQINDEIIIADDFKCKVLNKTETGEVELYFDYNNLLTLLEKYGYMPLPPYIKRDVETNIIDDKQHYQSIFAQHLGAIAAPTASLHFTHQLINQLANKNINIAFVTLHVGAGTFLPIKAENILEHNMHKEYGELSSETINLINKTKQIGGKVIAVGSTSLRILEFVFQKNNALVPFQGEIDLFIHPPFSFQIVDRLLTNFHLPKSSLFVLVCAFSGIKVMQEAYKYAIQNQYRFFSYGDCCLLNKQV